MSNLRSAPCPVRKRPQARDTAISRSTYAAGLALLAALCGANFGEAQQAGNPWKPIPPSYNRYTGAGRTATTPNPLTGAPAVAVHPLTGTPLPPPTAHNPFMGKPGTGFAASQPPPTIPARSVPISGKAGPGLEPLDEAILAIMDHHGIPGASLAIAKAGKLIYVKGFGWANLADDVPVEPFTIFGLASCSKPITALAILALFEQGKLDLDDRVLDLLKHLRPPKGSKVDPRLRNVTVRQCLNHTGGWDRGKGGDPMNQTPQIARKLGVPQPLTEDQFLSYMLGVALDFDPGTDMKYSNVGYIMLGRIVEKVSGQPYDEFVREAVLKPAGVQRAYVSEGKGRYKTGEAASYLAGTNLLLPPMDLRLIRAAAGWNTTAVDLVRVLTALDGSRGKGLFKEKTLKMMLAPPPPPLTVRKDGTHNGLGWPTCYLGPKGIYGYFHDGQLHGQRTFMKRSDKGVNWVLLFNVTMQPDQNDLGLLREAVEDVRRRVEALGEYPGIDLFDEFR